MFVNLSTEFEVTIPVILKVRIDTENRTLDDYVIEDSSKIIKENIEDFIKKYEKSMLENVFEEQEW